MNGIWTRLALIAGVTAVFGISEIDQLFTSLLKIVLSRRDAALIGFAIIVFFGWRVVQKHELPERYRSPAWALAALAVASFVLFVGPNLTALFGYRLGRTIRFLNFPVVQTAATIVLLAALLKVATELRPQFESEQREPDLTWWLIAGLTAFIGATFYFIPTTWLPPVDWTALMQGRLGDSMSSWPTWVQWGLAFAAAYLFVTTQRVDERISVDRPGVGMLRAAVIIMVIGMIVGMGVTAAARSSQQGGLVLIVAMVLMMPLGVIGKFLVTFGGLRLLFSLLSADRETSSATTTEAAPPVTAPKAALPAREYFVRAEADPAPSTRPITTMTPAAVPATASIATAASEEEQLRAALAKNPIDPRRHDRLQRILASDSTRTAEMLAHAKEFMAVLLGQSLREQALALYRACIVRDQNFKPHGDQVLPLVRILLMEKDVKSALRIVNRFDADFPQHRDTAQVFFLTARMLKDVQQPERAAQVLKLVISRFPEDRVVHDARTLLASLGAS